jgi:hypothetical protein
VIEIKNRNYSLFLVFIGIFLLITSIFYLSKSTIILIAQISFSIFLIIIGIFNHKELSAIVFGVILLIFLLIWNSIYNTSFIEIISILMFSIICIIVGILSHFDYLKKKF